MRLTHFTTHFFAGPRILRLWSDVDHWTSTFLLRWGWVFLERTQILSGIQFTTFFIKNFGVETNRFVCNFVHVILTRQTCGQNSSRAAESKRRALGNYFSERICYMFLISKCRGDWNLGLYTTSVLAFGEPQRHGEIRFFLHHRAKHVFFFDFAVCSRSTHQLPAHGGGYDPDNAWRAYRPKKLQLRPRRTALIEKASHW